MNVGKIEFSQYLYKAMATQCKSTSVVSNDLPNISPNNTQLYDKYSVLSNVPSVNSLNVKG
jgi:hypothetical protein